ncbi:hypothetical protein VP01_6635g1, partial [Puccinia sorghi]
MFLGWLIRQKVCSCHLGYCVRGCLGWLLNPKIFGKATSTILISFLDRHLALDIETAGLCYNSLHLKGQYYLQGPRQCYNCLAVGHLLLQVEVGFISDIDIADPKYDYSPFSNACPICTKELATLSKDKNLPQQQ